MACLHSHERNWQICCLCRPHCRLPAIAVGDSQQMQHRLLAACLAAATAALLLTRATAQCPQHDWHHRAHSCYKWFSDPHYWFQAEQTCLSHRAHLASIQSEQENRLVGRLSHCRDVWIGRFGTNLDRLADPRSYRWTDGSDAVRFERHNFSQLDSVHKPLIRSDGEWWLNSLYHERHPFVCEVSANSSLVDESSRSRCPSGWSLHNNQCYVMPHFEANFNEANFYCQRNSSHLVSVLTQSELDLVNKLSFGIDSCETPDRLDSVWIGLIKLNPCFPDSAGRELCYQWTDFSGKHDNRTLLWETGHPDSADWTVNCVTLSGGRLHSDRCHSRHRFVCKSAASNGTDGGVTSSPDGGISTPTTPPPIEGLVAAFDFRTGLDNLVDPRTFIIEDKFGVQRTTENGACFFYDNYDYHEFYNVGGPVFISDSVLNRREWTMYFKMMNVNATELRFVSVHSVNKSWDYHNSNFFAYYDKYYSKSVDLSYFNSTNEYEMNFDKHYYNGTACEDWCDLKLVKEASSMNSRLNGKSSYHSTRWVERHRYIDFGLQQLQIGVTSSHYWNRGMYCLKCFGLAYRKLSDEEMKRAMSFYCP